MSVRTDIQRAFENLHSTQNTPKVKSLYKLSRNILFTTNYICDYCCMIDFEKHWMQKHIIKVHDEFGKVTTLFECNTCKVSYYEDEIVQHLALHH